MISHQGISMQTPSSKQHQNVKLLETLLKGSYIQAQAAQRWLIKQSIDLQLWANHKATECYMFMKKKHSDIDKGILSIVASANVALDIQNTFTKSHRKNPEFQSDDIPLMDLLEENGFSKVKRASPKRQYLQMHQKQIFKWRELGVSFSKIEARLLTPDGESISAEYIRQYVNNKKEVS